MQCSLPLCWHCWCPRHCQSHQRSRRETGRQLAKRRKAPVLQVPVGLHSGMQTACCDVHQACNQRLTSAEQNHIWCSMRAPPQQHQVCCNELHICNQPSDNNTEGHMWYSLQHRQPASGLRRASGLPQARAHRPMVKLVTCGVQGNTAVCLPGTAMQRFSTAQQTDVNHAKDQAYPLCCIERQ